MSVSFAISILEHDIHILQVLLNRWAFSSDFASSTRSTYNSLISNTSRLQEGYTWGSCYNDGSCAAGDVFTETVSVGDIVVNNQTIGVAREVNSRGVSLMGFLGLSFNQKSLS